MSGNLAGSQEEWGEREPQSFTCIKRSQVSERDRDSSGAVPPSPPSPRPQLPDCLFPYLQKSDTMSPLLLAKINNTQ